VAEVIWPNLDPALPPGPPILRIQLVQWDPAVTHGTALDADFTLTSSTGNSWAGFARNVIVP
jgi:hypothetical protein